MNIDKVNKLNSVEIKKLRKQYFTNQQGFADVCGFGQASVQRWEAGTKKPLKSHVLMMKLYRDIPAVREYLKQVNQIDMEKVYLEKWTH